MKRSTPKNRGTESSASSEASVRALTAKQQAFVAEYLTDMNATQAAIRAGNKAKEADQTGPRLVGKSRIRQAIQAAMSTRITRLGVAADDLVRELILLAFSNVNDYQVANTGHLTTRPGVSSDTLQAVKSSCHRVRSITRGFDSQVIDSRAEVIIELFDKVRALSVLASHLGLVNSASAAAQKDLFARVPPEVAKWLRTTIETSDSGIVKH